MREGLGRYKVRKILTKIERVKKKKKKAGWWAYKLHECNDCNVSTGEHLGGCIIKSHRSD